MEDTVPDNPLYISLDTSEDEHLVEDEDETEEDSIGTCYDVIPDDLDLLHLT